MDKVEEQLRAGLEQAISEVTCGEDNLAAAAVLVLLIQVEGNWNILYTRRTNGVRTHQGEVSFPGGAVEKSDSSLIEAALREAKEEIGIKPEDVTILGGMPAYKTVTHFIVYPFVGILNGPPEFHLNVDEVERVFMIPVKWLKEENNYYEKEHILNGTLFRKVIHYHEFDGEHLWGFTARLTQQVIKLLA